jgi:hypothetical protein
VAVPVTLILIIHDGYSVYKYWYEYRDILHEPHEIQYTNFCSFVSAEVYAALMLTILVSSIIIMSARGFDSAHLEEMCSLHVQRSRKTRRIFLELLDP